MSWFRRSEEAPEPAVAVSMVAQPISINPEATEAIQQASYRIHAIVRYLEQTEFVSQQKREEFIREGRMIYFALLGANAFDKAYLDVLAEKIGF
jgi:microsomal dipeptidase-like Zn-dependent dipeptidase